MTNSQKNRVKRALCFIATIIEGLSIFIGMMTTFMLIGGPEWLALFKIGFIGVILIHWFIGVVIRSNHSNAKRGDYIYMPIPIEARSTAKPTGAKPTGSGVKV